MKRQHKGAFLSDGDGTCSRFGLEQEMSKLLRQAGLVRPERHAKALELERERRSRRVRHRVMNDAWVAANNTDGFEGVSVEDMKGIGRRLAEERGDEMYSWARELILSCREHEFFLGMISGSSEDAVIPFYERLGFHEIVGSRYPTRDGVHIAGPGEWPARDKGVVGSKMLQDNGFTAEDCIIAMGDTTGDFSMLQLARWPIASNPNGELLAMFETNKHPHRPYSIVRESKDGITITAVLHDHDGSAYERSCGLEDILPREIALDMRRRLGDLLRFPNARLPASL